VAAVADALLALVDMAADALAVGQLVQSLPEYFGVALDLRLRLDHQLADSSETPLTELLAAMNEVLEVLPRPIHEACVQQAVLRILLILGKGATVLLLLQQLRK